MTRACKNCEWWDKFDASAGVGRCRTTYPQVRQGIRKEERETQMVFLVTAEWPTTAEDDWCGYFAERPPEPTPYQCSLCLIELEVGKLHSLYKGLPVCGVCGVGKATLQQHALRRVCALCAATVDDSVVMRQRSIGLVCPTCYVATLNTEPTQ